VKRIILTVIAAVLTVYTAARAQAPAPAATAPAGPVVAFDILKPDIDALLKNVMSLPGSDQTIRVVDMGKYNLGVGIIHRGPTKDKPGDPITAGLYHDYTAEVYIILSGGGVLTTGGVLVDKKPSENINIMNGPGGGAAAGRGAVSRKVGPGDIIIIPPGVLHAWSQITDEVTYLSVRPDPDRVLPAGYVAPALLKNQAPPAK
jgi:mannose-6-phosphate isomerase-like protein (cupin superfamily)